MTTIGMAHAPGRTMARSARLAGIIRQGLLWCGVLASLLYVATDILGGLRYPGYSFTPQAVSELMAIGAPSEAFVGPLLRRGVLDVVRQIRWHEEYRALRAAEQSCRDAADEHASQDAALVSARDD